MPEINALLPCLLCLLFKIIIVVCIIKCMAYITKRRNISSLLLFLCRNKWRQQERGTVCKLLETSLRVNPSPTMKNIQLPTYDLFFCCPNIVTSYCNIVPHWYFFLSSFNIFKDILKAEKHTKP